MPYRLDKCLIDLVSEIKQMKNKKGLRLMALESGLRLTKQVPVGQSKRAGVAALSLEQV